MPNRARFLDLLTHQASARREHDSRFAVLMIDLDRFKHVNDTLGHPVGDQLLRKVADRLTSIMRAGDILSRLGGDEFAVVLVDADPSAADQLAQGIVENICELPFLLDGQVVYIGASVGIACSCNDGDEPDELIRKADLALYAAKADGKGRLRRYDAALNAASMERRVLEGGLRQALTNSELELFYQPLVDTQTGRITSAEALVRWHHPERGMIPPADFISLAEDTGLILPLGDWVIRTACLEAASWPDDMSVAVNLSPVQFREPGLAASIETALLASGLQPDRLELEITEGVLLSEEDQTLATLTRLKAQGVRISMDDFGTGYSSLSYLRRFPFDKIKIDQSFVRQAPEDKECAAIVRAIITMGKCLGITTTVEGVETQEQHAFSIAEGCDNVQGYHISRPLPAASFAAFRQTWKTDRRLRTAA
ncbi:putative bifunctional diguanylate cyclase/phosphodiesterase [Croceicoccus marinus]|uniref:putative bifunctional diguanylate cyclase/phosphodiesterase n=1 Tax=Croceicoccus marinus TaxID=450378 RepID=UPI001FD62414|nr:EAL domain-containing protein [Croceicoccus marinus]